LQIDLLWKQYKPWSEDGDVGAFLLRGLGGKVCHLLDSPKSVTMAGYAIGLYKLLGKTCGILRAI